MRVVMLRHRIKALHILSGLKEYHTYSYFFKAYCTIFTWYHVMFYISAILLDALIQVNGRFRVLVLLEMQEPLS